MPAEAPAAPAAAPAPAPAPSAAPPPPSTEREPSQWMGDIEHDFGEMDAGREPAKRDEKGKFTPKEKAPEQPPVKAPAAAEEAPKEEAPPAPKPAEEPPKPVKAAELRTAYEGLKKKVAQEIEPELQSLRAKVREYEAKKPEDTAPMLAKTQAVEQENLALKKHLAYLDYTQELEYKKAQETYAGAWGEAVSEFEQLRVREPGPVDETTGEPTVKVRQATDRDLLKLANMSLADMDEAATAMFGPSAARAIAHLQNIRKLSRDKDQAEQKAQTECLNWKKQRDLEFQNRQQNASRAWAETNKALEEKFPKAFKVDETDPDDKAAHTKGFALSDLLFLGNNALTPEQVEALPAGFRDTVKAKQPLSEAQKVQLHALVRLKTANHDRLVKRLAKRDARIAELEKTVSEYEKSEPGTGSAGAPASVSGKGWQETVEDELRALDK